MNVQKIESGRAEYAYQAVEEYMTKYPTEAKEYANHLKKIPSMIQVNGLGQTMAYCFSKSTYRPIYDHIEKWLQVEPMRSLGEFGEGKMIAEIISLKSEKYRAVTKEVLALLSWMVRFAEGLKETVPMPKKEGEQ